MGKKIVGAKADEKRNITAVRFQGNQMFTSVETAIQMAEKGKIDNAHAVHRRNGTSYLRSNPDGKKKNNLDELAKD